MKMTKRVLFTVCFCMLFLFAGTTICFAAGSIEGSIASLNTLIRSVVKAIGGIATLWGVVQLGLAMKGHDAAQRSTALLAIAGGLMIFFAPEILDSIA
ncbi:MAG: glutamyl-tRNA amidotransferase [Clostridiales bacterium]|nr:glutamyl-tRNA amidotransferase [Clostridiales bacterium]